MDQSLRDAAEQGSIEDLYKLIGGNAKVLDTFDEIPFVDTPLHIAASAGHTLFAMEVMKLKPSFARKLNQNGFTPVHLALQNKKPQLVHRLLDVDDDLVRVQGREGMTPLHHVAREGDLYLLAEFLKVCPMSIKDVTIRRKTALHIALSNNQLVAFELLIRWLQRTTIEDASSLWEEKLLNWKDEDGQTLLHIAVEKTLPQVVELLLNARVDANTKNVAGFTALDILEGQTQIGNSEIIRDMLCHVGALNASSLPGVSENMENVVDLWDATQQGSVDALYASIKRDANVLDRIDEIPFVDTPLHIAASLGHTQFVMEIMRLKPSFAKKLNQDGFTPMHLALQNNRTQVVLKLLNVSGGLVGVQGREGMTPLHYLAQIENSTELLGKFLRICPKSIEDVTIRDETVLHIALKYNADNNFRFLLSWLRRACFKSTSFSEWELLNWQDEEGNTTLHIAASKNKVQIVKLLLDGRGLFRRKFLYYAAVDINAKNLDGRTALELAGQTQIENMLRRAGALSDHLPTVTSNKDFLKSPVPIWERLAVLRSRQKTQMTNEVRNILLVVMVLFVTVTYQAALNPPGGVWQDNYNPQTDQSNSTVRFNSTVPFNSTVSLNVTGELILPATQKAENEAPHMAGRVIMNRYAFFMVLCSNSVCFFLSIGIILILLPYSYCVFPMYYLILCYYVSFTVISPI